MSVKVIVKGIHAEIQKGVLQGTFKGKLKEAVNVIKNLMKAGQCKTEEITSIVSLTVTHSSKYKVQPHFPNHESFK